MDKVRDHLGRELKPLSIENALTEDRRKIERTTYVLEADLCKKKRGRNFPGVGDAADKYIRMFGGRILRLNRLQDDGTLFESATLVCPNGRLVNVFY